MLSYENERVFIVLKQTIPTEIPKTKNTRLKVCITKRENMYICMTRFTVICVKH